VFWLGLLLIGVYGPLLAGLARQWSTDPDMSHGFFVLPVVAFVVWRRRAELAAIDAKPNWWGLVVVAWGAVQMLLGTLAAQIFIARTAFLLSLTGAVLFLGGTRVLKILAFPLLLLLFLFPIPALVYARVTLPLQIFASAAAEMVLNWIGIPVLRDGNILELPHERLSVVEACSGIRSLLSMGFLSLVYGYFFDRRVAMRWVLLGATVPIAITANAVRVTLMGVLGEYRTDLAQGAFHLFEGWVLFVVALSLLVTLHQLLRRSRRLLTCAVPYPATHRAVTVRERSLLVLTTLFLFQGAAFYGLSQRVEAIAASKPLAEFATSIGDWRMVREGVIDQEDKDVLRADDYLTRQYAAVSGESANLFVAYFQSQRAGQTPHSPKNCLPGSGWTWSVADTIPVDIVGRAQPIEINRYIVSKGDDHAVVLYWYQSRDRVVASEYRAALFTAWDALRSNHTDTELVRVVTPVTASGVKFIQAFFPQIAPLQSR
jgi:exosortase D (VPLPA-CTERM-specific)